MNRITTFASVAGSAKDKSGQVAGANVATLLLNMGGTSVGGASDPPIEFFSTPTSPMTADDHDTAFPYIDRPSLVQSYIRYWVLGQKFTPMASNHLL